MSARRTPSVLKKSSDQFLDFLDHWLHELPVVSLKSLTREVPVEQSALFCVDLTNGFCKEGNLSSPRVGRIVEPIVQLFKNAEQLGMNHYVLPQDAHPQDSKEFEIYPPHCVEGTEESKTVTELNELPHSYKFRVIPKNNINPGMEKDLQQWVQEHPEIRQYIVVGDCTDICVFHLAMYLKLQAIQRNERNNVVVPANCVDTFDISMEVYKEKGISPHPGELMHRIFLYTMHLNGIRVVAAIE